METKTVTFIKFHPAFSDSDDLGVPKVLEKVAAQKAIDLGVAIAGKGSDKETADATPSAQVGMIEPVTESAVDASLKQRAEAHGINIDSVQAGNDEFQAILPVATEPDGNKILVRPEDNALEQTSAPGVKVADKKKS